MALLFMDGFDHYQSADILKKWSYKGSFAAISNTGGRRGGGCLSISSLGNPSSIYGIGKNLPAYTSTVIMGAAVVPALLDTNYVFLVADGTYIQVSICVMANGSIKVLGASSLTVLGQSAPNVVKAAWNYMEVKVVYPTGGAGTATGAVEVRVNGTTVLSLTNAHTADSTSTTNQYGSVYLAGQGSYDDCYICDTTGTVNNTYLGDCRVDAYYPSSEGVTVTTPVAGVEQWTPTPTGSHWPCVSTQYPAATPTTYVTDGAVIGNTDEYGITDMANTPLAVFGVQMLSLANTSDAGNATIANGLVIETGASPGRYYSPNLAVVNTPLYARHIWDTNPSTGAAWTKTDVNAALASIKRSS